MIKKCPLFSIFVLGGCLQTLQQQISDDMEKEEKCLALPLMEKCTQVSEKSKVKHYYLIIHVPFCGNTGRNLLRFSFPHIRSTENQVVYSAGGQPVYVMRESINYTLPLT